MRQTKIYVLSLTLLKNDKHMAITAFMAKALSVYSIADTSLAVFVAAYLAAYEKENRAFQRIDKKILTKSMNDADQARINALRVLRDLLKTFEFRPNEEQKALAQNVLEVIELYGGQAIFSQAIDSRTGNISNIIEDLEQKLSEAIAALELTAYVQALKDANNLFLERQFTRDETNAEYGTNAMADARVETDKIWRALVEEANNAIAYGPEEDLEKLVPFAKVMNEEINKYRIQNGQGVVGGSSSSGSGSGGSSSGGSGSGGSGSTGGGTETTPTMKDATFRKADGTAIVLPFAVGAPVTAPPNTVGYKWKPTPNVMPKTNKTFTEVPIVDRETIATFHFADHTEEEIRQFVGTLLHTPANTDGYFWQPTPPETMPAEDTQYYEQPINNDNNQGGDNTGGDQTGGDNTGSGDNGGNNGGYPPGYDPDADDDPGV